MWEHFGGQQYSFLFFFHAGSTLFDNTGKKRPNVTAWAIRKYFTEKTLELDIKESAWLCQVLLLHALPLEKVLAYHCVPNSTATSPTQMICVLTVCFKIGKPGIYFTWKQFFTWSATHIVPTTTHCTGTIKFLKIVGSHAGVVTQITELDCSKFP